MDLPEAGIDTDVCIVGGGPAGIAAALRLDERGVDVVLLEAGGDQPSIDPATMDGDNLGREYPILGTRMQGLGGTSGHWTGVCRPLEPEDFEERSWIAHSGWPIGRDDLDVHYEAAHNLLQLGPYDYQPEAWSDASRVDRPTVSHPIIPVVFQYSPPTRFGPTYGPRLNSSRRVTVVTEARVNRIRSGSDGRVTGVDVRDLSGRTVEVRASDTVLAAGALETSRLMLASDDVQRSGVGNGQDLVGRFFMEHPIVWEVPMLFMGDVTDVEFFGVGAADFASGVQRWRGHFVLDPKIRRREGLLGSYGALSVPGLQGLGAMSASADPTRVAPVAGVAGTVADRADLAEMFGYVSLVLEQAPNPNSRITVDRTQIDDAGLPRLQLDWRFTDDDRRSLESTLDLVAAAFGAGHLGRLRTVPRDVETFLELVGPASHHLGGTRMADSPRSGVVDADCKVHGLTGLSVAGGAVFPTAGFANPTLTIVALALRLADHLARQRS
jgi:choline dehydrogenase-like flavoprotein